MSDIKMLTVQAALRKLTEQSYFDICAIDKIVKLLDVKPDADAYAILNTLHCVDYNKMPAELLAALPDVIMKVLKSPTMDISRVNIISHETGMRLVKG